MGLLKKGEILPWTSLNRRKNIIKNRGVDQFIAAFNKYNSISTPNFAIGEEIEFLLVFKDKSYKLYCGSEKIIEKNPFCAVEYGRYMLEISSKDPLRRNTIMDLEDSVLTKIKKLNEDDVKVVLLSCYPNMCFENFYDIDNNKMRDDITYSLHFPDNAICQHKRFYSFTQNIRNRRGKKIQGYIEIMKDKNTAVDETNKYILIDSMGQGMGCCCLQTTIQGSNLEETRHLYDMMGILSPLLLRLSRGTPCANGKLLNTETRWDMLEMSVDCRTDQERGSNWDVSGNKVEYNYNTEIPKSRFSPLDLFISNHQHFKEKYNDIYVPINNDSLQRLRKNKIDEKMSKHIASLFVRDPIISYENPNEELYEDFENIQSSNWRSMRFKIPSESMPDDLKGWKIEVRTIDMQATAFENCAFVYFTFFLSRAILKYDLNLYIPISKLDANFKRANLFIRNVNDLFNKLEEDKQRFYYRTNITNSEDPKIEEGTLKDIFIGNETYTGLLEYVKKVINEDFSDIQKQILKYIQFIEDKIMNKYMSFADWIRKFIVMHDDYKRDSLISNEIINDLIEELIRISESNKVDYLLN